MTSVLSIKVVPIARGDAFMISATGTKAGYESSREEAAEEFRKFASYITAVYRPKK